MAIGDTVAVQLGSGAESYQPASGVEVEISAIIKGAATDRIALYDGSTLFNLTGTFRTDTDGQDTSTVGLQFYNLAYIITNTIYIRKDAANDIYMLHGVQFNS